MTCPLCLHPDNAESLRSGPRTFRRCSRCRLAFAPAELTHKQERGRYDLHQNRVDDPAYRAFLEPTLTALEERVPLPARGLDFGAGPGPALARMFEEKGYRMALYDLFFHPDPAVLEKQYDFVACTETAEHFRDPRRELFRIWNLIRSGGWAAFRTELYSSEKDFPSWHYPRDPTHLCIFSRETMDWLAAEWKATVVYPAPNLALFQKP